MTTLPKNIDDPCYHDDDAARISLEAIFWPYGATCPVCRKTERVSEYGKSLGKGWTGAALAGRNSRFASAPSWSAVTFRCTNGCSGFAFTRHLKRASVRINSCAFSALVHIVPHGSWRIVFGRLWTAMRITAGRSAATARLLKL